MKKFIIAIMAFAFFAVSCENSKTASTQDNAKTEEINVEEITPVNLAEFDSVVENLVGKKIVVTGTADHICKHGGQRMFIVDTGSEGRVKVTPDENVAAFNTDLEGQSLKIVGIVEEQRIDEAYLREWEEEILSDADMGDDKGEGSHIGGNVEKGGSDADKNEEMEKVNNLREMLAESGKDHLSFYSILCVEYEILDDTE
ncbi:MAG: hypothetical protein L3J66_10330 [Bacteroidales bacterium]|nr:hypothetical protein [Bacteroidales bacterium]